MGILDVAREVLKEELREEGKIKGEQEATTSIAKKLKTLGISARVINKSTGLSLKQIKML